ncbi:hypothetical protein [Rhizobium sp. B21/90]|uniref:hypothetical protein n=1 Tax=Rhizobium sp. B21/90 TaxID=2819993 RepID=UPI001C5B6FE6|nr:hypothetical protein [Rhizobium sp. B21/90]QYA04523.1 hypothetical protein J5278_20375 [Rhizobium sp. B21/90]
MLKVIILIAVVIVEIAMLLIEAAPGKLLSWVKVIILLCSATLTIGLTVIGFYPEMFPFQA